MKPGRSLLFVLAALVFCVDASAQTDPKPDLTQELAQTIASLFSITIQDYFVASRWTRPGTANAVEFRSLMPFQVWDQDNLMRISIPFRTESELGPGLSDARIFDLVMFKKGSGFWGVGPDFNLGINRGPGVDAFQMGPAAAFMITSIRKLSIGLLNQNFFSGQQAFSALQPIVVYQPTEIWTISLGELPLVYNWKKDDFSVFSLGLQIGGLARLGQQPVRFFVNPQFNTTSSTQLYQWTFTFGMTVPIRPVAR